MSRVQSYEQALLLRIPDAPLVGHMPNARSQASQKGFTRFSSCLGGGSSLE